MFLFSWDKFVIKIIIFFLKCGLPKVPYEKGIDILDIWLDSGISWKNVLPGMSVLRFY